MIANLNIDRDCTGRYDFNVTTELVSIEHILNKYITIPSGLSFVKGVTSPIYDRAMLSRYIDNKIEIHSVPQSPFLAPSIVKDILELNIINSNPDSSMLYVNKLLDKESLIYDNDKNRSVVDILTSVLPFNNGNYNTMYTNEDLQSLVGLCNSIVDKFNIVIGNDFRYIYSIDITKEIFVIYKYITIGEYRYNECEFVMDIEKEYKGEHDDVHGESLRYTK